MYRLSDLKRVMSQLGSLAHALREISRLSLGLVSSEDHGPQLSVGQRNMTRSRGHRFGLQMGLVTNKCDTSGTFLV